MEVNSKWVTLPLNRVTLLLELFILQIIHFSPKLLLKYNVSVPGHSMPLTINIKYKIYFIVQN